MGSDPTLPVDSTRVTTVTRSDEERALSNTEPSTTNDDSSSVCAPALSVGSLALHEKPSAAAVEASQDAPVSSDRAPSTQIVYLTDASSTASAARCSQPIRSVPLMVSPAAGGVTSGGAGVGVCLLHALASTSVRTKAPAKSE